MRLPATSYPKLWDRDPCAYAVNRFRLSGVSETLVVELGLPLVSVCVMASMLDAGS